MADAAVSHLHGDLHLDVPGALRKSGDSLVTQVPVHSLLVLILATDGPADNARVRIDPSPMCLLPGPWLDRERKIVPQLLDLVRRQVSTGRCSRDGIVAARLTRRHRRRLPDDPTGVVQQVSTCGCGEFGSLVQALNSRCGGSNGLTGGRIGRPTGQFAQSPLLLMDGRSGG
ncbi:hypothetical protein OG958_24400 [Micromonospora sp. NBC_01813]|nr:hypothetical protein [Micromonospora sp. NBC_01813]WSA07369.1 hypothetical protein OG958_24400 [Micromonospora sp. NBC_01813]